MNWNFTANSPDELANIGHKLLNAAKQTFLDEQWQMSQLLKAMSSASIFEFPVRVRHTGVRGVPDFQIESGGHRIAIELAKITTQDVEHARGLQRKGLKRTLGISSLYLKKSKPRTVDEIIKEGFSYQPFRFGVSPEGLNEIWIKEVTTQLDKKTAVLRGKQFEHGHEDWLVLWDQIGTDEYEIKSRIEVVKKLLASRWKLGWYSRVFIQQIGSYPFLAIFSETGIISIPKNFEGPANNYPTGFIFSGSPDD
jgi:hypothetical protein